ncbi:HlyD family type I secretion periplasmic adaptor subunit [Ensifer sp. ENS11]|uniref:HlyD family type I secretion periplasmic adaptor subunit n=1 Tax=Ensifer sp. ENS11 TaxID=2769291 RepID=UPI00177AFBF3|nr:HlyD family type I secretion periplasmic adaptor subunit [Ensifer sp. ENS11]MBD9490468.1 HlyD family type I secretion periplasmic adaptor subunit [Ensifer sp. ENS11]
MMSEATSRASKAITRYMLWAGCSIGVLLIGAGGWAATSKLSGAVVGMGTVVVEGNVKRIQHREGGIVGDIRVRDGAQVKVGDLLIRLDDTVTRANLAIVTKQIDQLNARAMRLVAERDNTTEIKVPADLRAKLDQAEVADYVQSERALFVARRQTIDGQKDQLKQRIGQLQQETDGLTARRAAKDDELKFIVQELTGIASLHDKGLMPFSRLAELQRMKAQLSGERGQLTAEIARAATRTTETELQILQLDQDRRSEVLTELRDVDNKLAELTEQQVTATDQLKRIDLLSPQDGIVHELAVHTVGGVISPGETLMQIVPVNDSLVVEAKVQPADIDQLHIGQDAVLRFSAFNQRTTPEIIGSITTIAANLSSNPQTGETWYTARVRIAKPELARLGSLVLHAGMPVEAFIQTGERSALSYLVKPLADQIARAMRED